MLLNLVHNALGKPARLLLSASLLAALAACGGGGGSPGATDTGPGNPTPTPTPTPAASASVALVGADGVALKLLAGNDSGTARAVFKNAAGTPAANVIVKFSVSDPLLVLAPESGSTLTDDKGVAVVTVKLAPQAKPGAVAISVSGTVEGAVLTASVNVAVGSSAVVFEPTLALSVVGTDNAPVTALAGSQRATVRSVIKDSTGAIAPNTIVQFSLNNPLLVFTPSSGSALTDAAGVATISVMPVAPTAAGAVTITATAVVGGKSATATSNLTVGLGPLTVSSVAFAPAPSGSLPAQSSAALNIAITSGGELAQSAAGLVLSSLCVADGTATLVAGSFANGVQTATYVNKGCSRITDVITASIGASSLTTSIGVDPASIGTIQFVSSSSAGKSIVLRGSGGLGRQESALLTYRVVDQNNTGLAGVPVSFAASTATGGLTVLPATGTSDANGNVTTTVSSGTIPTPVRVLAQASRSGRTITGLSDALLISTGLPMQKAFSLSVDAYNINGWNQDGNIANVTVRLADQYGNPISDNTSVSFVTEGGAIGTPDQGGCQTTGGGCSVTLKSQNFRPTNGRVTVLAYVQGIENFIDSNGDGQYSCTNFTAPDGSVPAIYRPLIDICVSGGEPFTDMGDPFLDAGFLGSVVNAQGPGSLDGSYDAPNGDLPFPYNRTAYSEAGNGKWGLNFIRATTEITFSDSVPQLVRQFCDSSGCRDWLQTDGLSHVIAPGADCKAAKQLMFRLVDVNNNPLPYETAVTAGDPANATVSAMSPNLVGSTSAIGGTIHNVTVTPSQECKAGSFSVIVESPRAQAAATKYTYVFSLPAVTPP